MRRKPVTLAILSTCLLLSACVSTWDYPDGAVSSSSKTYEISFPDGWSYLPTDGGKTLLSSYDGPLLQVIRVVEYDLAEKLPYSEQSVSKDISVEELGDILFQEYFKTPGVTGPTLESAAPSSIDDAEGVEIVYSHSNDAGLRYRSIARGAIKENTLYVIEYSAPTRHYFEKFDDNVEVTVNSFKFTKSQR